MTDTTNMVALIVISVPTWLAAFFIAFLGFIALSRAIEEAKKPGPISGATAASVILFPILLTASSLLGLLAKWMGGL